MVSLLYSARSTWRKKARATLNFRPALCLDLFPSSSIIIIAIPVHVQTTIHRGNQFFITSTTVDQ
ncbi:hypothetical protein, partial [Erythrobacter sp. YJ-T3-07]|uniref:hypothetical protein n=1 Tax=Erythrobacter sp. YJ-T3-07 TaxID=2793063 RepID=UPI001F2324F5